MLRSSINELNVDGCNIHFFNILAQQGPKQYLSGFPLHIPISIFFESGVPRAWYSNAVDGTVTRKESKQFTVDDIWSALVKGRPAGKLSPSGSLPKARLTGARPGAITTSDDDIVAVMISVPPPSYEVEAETAMKQQRQSGRGGSSHNQTVTHHLTRAMLRQLLYGRDGGSSELQHEHRRFLLQQFQYPQGWYNSVIRVTWAPKLSVVDTLRSSCSLRDSWKNPDIRGGTFENPSEAVRTSLPDTVHHAVKETCRFIALHVSDVAGGASVAGMLLYFKINSSRELLFLYPGSLRVYPASVPSPQRTSTLKLIDRSPSGSVSSTPPPIQLSSPQRRPSLSGISPSLEKRSSLAPSVGGGRLPKDNEAHHLNIWHDVSSGLDLKRRSDLDVLGGSPSPEIRKGHPSRCLEDADNLYHAPHGVTHRVGIPTTEELYVAAARSLGIPLPRCLEKKFKAGGVRSSVVASLQPPAPVQVRLQCSPYLPLHRNGHHQVVHQVETGDEFQNYHCAHHTDNARIASPRRASPTFFRNDGSGPASPSLQFVQHLHRQKNGRHLGVRLRPLRSGGRWGQGGCEPCNNSARHLQHRASVRQVLKHAIDYQTPESLQRRSGHTAKDQSESLLEDADSTMRVLLQQCADRDASITFPLPYMRGEHDSSIAQIQASRASNDGVTSTAPPCPSVAQSSNRGVERSMRVPTQTDAVVRPPLPSPKRANQSAERYMSYGGGGGGQQHASTSVLMRRASPTHRSIRAPLKFTPSSTLHDSLTASLRSVESSSLFSPLGQSPHNRRQALEAMQDLLYCIRGALPKSQPTAYRCASSSNAARFDFDFDPTVLAPHLVSTTFSPLGACVRPNPPSGGADRRGEDEPVTIAGTEGSSNRGLVSVLSPSSLVVSLVPPVHQSDLLKAVHLCEQNIKQFKRRGFPPSLPPPPPSSPPAQTDTCSSSTPPTLEFLCESYEVTRLAQQHCDDGQPPPSNVSLIADHIPLPPTQRDLLSQNADGSHTTTPSLRQDQLHNSIAVFPPHPIQPIHELPQASPPLHDQPRNAHPSETTPIQQEEQTPTPAQLFTPPQDILDALLEAPPRTPPCTRRDD